MKVAAIILAAAALLSPSTATWTPLPSPTHPSSQSSSHSDDLSAVSKRGAPAGFAGPLHGAAIASGYAAPPVGVAAVAGVGSPYALAASPYTAAVPAVGTPLWGALPAQLARAPHYVPSVSLAPAPYLAKPAYATSAYAPPVLPLGAPAYAAPAPAYPAYPAPAYPAPSHAAAPIPSYPAAKAPVAHPGLTAAYFG